MIRAAVATNVISSQALTALNGGGGMLRYEAACRALAEAKSIDEVKDFRNKAEAMRAYAKQAENKQLETDAAEIRIRATRRLGELMAATRLSDKITYVVIQHEPGNPMGIESVMIVHGGRFSEWQSCSILELNDRIQKWATRVDLRDVSVGRAA